MECQWIKMYFLAIVILKIPIKLKYLSLSHMQTLSLSLFILQSVSSNCTSLTRLNLVMVSNVFPCWLLTQLPQKGCSFQKWSKETRKLSSRFASLDLRHTLYHTLMRRSSLSLCIFLFHMISRKNASNAFKQM